MRAHETERLEGVSIERPCPKRWSELVGDEKRRFCSECALHVTNLSALTRAEATDFLSARSGRVCVTYVPTEDGGAKLQAEAGKGLTRLPFLARGLARAASFVLGLLCLLPGCRPTPTDTTGSTPPDPDDAGSEGRRLMGKVRADPVCQVDDDDRMIMGEMVAPVLDPVPTPPAPDDPAH